MADSVTDGTVIAGGQRLPERGFKAPDGKKSSKRPDILVERSDGSIYGINPNNGAKEYYKNYCYTLSAKELFQKGIRITPYTGWNEYILNEEIK
ncbi:hypothetical protein [Clostridium sp. UBA6640]|uniref:hypothetical protein n=1 Tax=Clostridium sp. UBA6640 TaxID=1946370 RepID=UPI0025BBC19D|nr:hypothetical protein [Clostridium sp. UBA6640]